LRQRFDLDPVKAVMADAAELWLSRHPFRVVANPPRLPSLRHCWAGWCHPVVGWSVTTSWFHGTWRAAGLLVMLLEQAVGFDSSRWAQDSRFHAPPSDRLHPMEWRYLSFDGDSRDGGEHGSQLSPCHRGVASSHPATT